MTGSTTPSDQPNSDTHRKIATLFRLMKANYNHKYTSTFKSKEDVIVAMKLWARNFGHVDDALLQYALKSCFHDLDWPPTIKEFRARVKKAMADRAAHTPLIRHTPSQTPEVREREIANMKEILSR